MTRGKISASSISDHAASDHAASEEISVWQWASVVQRDADVIPHRAHSNAPVVASMPNDSATHGNVKNRVPRLL